MPFEVFSRVAEFSDDIPGLSLTQHLSGPVFEAVIDAASPTLAPGYDIRMLGESEPVASIRSDGFWLGPGGATPLKTLIGYGGAPGAVAIFDDGSNPGAVVVGFWEASIIDPAFGGTGLDGSAAPDGSVLIGNGTGYTLATLIQGTNIVITNGAGTIRLDVPVGAGGLTSVTASPPVTSSGGVTPNIALTTPLAVGYGGTGQDWSSAGANTLPFFSGMGAMGLVGAAGSSVLVTSAGNVPSLSQTLPNTVQDNITRLGTVTSGVWHGTAVATGYGGTGQDFSAATQYDLLYFSNTGTLGLIASATSSVLITSPGSVPSLSQTLPSAVQDNITRLGFIVVGTWTATAIGAQYGGTGQNTTTWNGIPTMNAGVWAENNVLTANRILYAAAGNTITTSADYTFDGGTLTLANQRVQLWTNSAGIIGFAYAQTSVGGFAIGDASSPRKDWYMYAYDNVQATIGNGMVTLPNAQLSVQSTSGTALVTIKAATAGQQAQLRYLDGATEKWQLVKTGANNLEVYDSGNSLTVMRFVPTATTPVVGINVTPTSLGSNITTLHIRGTSSTRSGGIRLDSSDASASFAMYFQGGEFDVGASTNHPLVFLSNNTEVGRWTTSALTVSHPTSTATLLITATTAGQVATLRLVDASTARWSIYKDASNDFVIYDDTAPANSLKIVRGGGGWTITPAVAMSSTLYVTGTVGIGTTSPSSVLDVVKNGAIVNINIHSYSSVQTFHRPQLSFFKARGTEASPGAVQSGDALWGIEATGRNPNGSGTFVGGIYMYATGTVTGSNVPSYMAFYTNQSNSGVEVARLESDGGFLVSTGTPTGGSKGAGTINVSGDYYRNGSVLNEVRSGTIQLWSGTLASIPSGYVLCDGNNSAPNLLAKFVRGVATGATNPGGTGGADTTTLTTTELPAHTHSTGQASSAASVGGGQFATGGNSGNAAINTQSGGTGSAFSRLPTYFELAFIMKT